MQIRGVWPSFYLKAYSFLAYLEENKQLKCLVKFLWLMLLGLYKPILRSHVNIAFITKALKSKEKAIFLCKLIQTLYTNL